MAGIQIRLAEPPDAADIARLFATSFEPDIAQLLIYGCPGAAEYIRMQLTSTLPAESFYCVAYTPGDNIVGAAELRRQANRLFLNYIAVDPRHRGQRVGGILFSTTVAMSGVSAGRIELDVLDNNSRARQWYERLGFKQTTTTDFLELASPGPTNTEPVYLSGLPQAEVCQQRFGFSMFNLLAGDTTFSVGRIGNNWFRLTAPDAIASPAVFAALRRLDPCRRIFAVLPASAAPPAHAVSVLAKTHRMECLAASLR